MCEEQKNLFNNSQYKKMLAKPPVQLKSILLKQLDSLHMNYKYNNNQQQNKNSNNFNNPQIPFVNIYDYYLEYLNRKDLIENNLSLHHNDVSRQQIVGVIDQISHVELCKLISNEEIKNGYIKNFLEPVEFPSASCSESPPESIVVEYKSNKKTLPPVIEPLSFSISHPLPPLPPPFLPLPMKKIPIFTLNPTFDNLNLSSFKTTPHFHLPVLTQKNILSTKYPLSLISYTVPMKDSNFNNLGNSNTNCISKLYSTTSNSITSTTLNTILSENDDNLKETLTIENETTDETETENENETTDEIKDVHLDKESEFIEDYITSEELQPSTMNKDKQEIDVIKTEPLTNTSSKYINYCLIN